MNMTQNARLAAIFIAFVIWRITSPTTSASENSFAPSEMNWKKHSANWTNFHE